MATGDAHVWALDARTGRPFGDFGTEWENRPDIGVTGERPALRAFDKATGDVVHVVELTVAPTGTPITYMRNGKQFIVMAYGSGAESGLIALALPS